MACVVRCMYCKFIQHRAVAWPGRKHDSAGRAGIRLRQSLPIVCSVVFCVASVPEPEPELVHGRSCHGLDAAAALRCAALLPAAPRSLPLHITTRSRQDCDFWLGTTGDVMIARAVLRLPSTFPSPFHRIPFPLPSTPSAFLSLPLHAPSHPR
nr:hypothetical protein CFP56_00192 [Quercus suber]